MTENDYAQLQAMGQAQRDAGIKVGDYVRIKPDVPHDNLRTDNQMLQAGRNIGVVTRVIGSDVFRVEFHDEGVEYTNHLMREWLELVSIDNLRSAPASAALVAALAEVERLRGELYATNGHNEEIADAMTLEQNDNAAKNKRIAELEAALKPFADAAERMNGHTLYQAHYEGFGKWGYSPVLHNDNTEDPLTITHFRNAAEALMSGGKP